MDAQTSADRDNRSGVLGSSLFCVVIPAPFLTGGIERLSWDVVRALMDAMGADRVEVAAIIGKRDPTDAPPLPIHIPYLGPARLTSRSKVRFAAWMLGQARRSRPVFVCMHAAQAPLAWIAKAMFGTPYIVWAHGAEVWGKLGWFQRRALLGARWIVCSSNFTRGRIVDRQGVGHCHAVTVHPPVTNDLVSHADGALSAAATEPVILSVGRVEKAHDYKGFDAVIDAMPRILERVPDALYFVVGGGDGVGELRSRAHAVGVAESVRFTGEVSDTELARQYAAARVFVLASRVIDGPNPRGEGFGIASVEAAAYGRPVVVGSGGGTPETVEDGVTGSIVDATSIRSVADAVLEFLTDPQKAALAGDAGRKRVMEKFAFSQFRASLLRLVIEPVRGS